MALRKLVKRITTPTDEVDRDKLTSWCELQGGMPLNEVQPRRPVFIAGEIRSVRIVPAREPTRWKRQCRTDAARSPRFSWVGAASKGSHPGRRVMLEGVVSPNGERYMYNPVYTLA